MAMDIQRIESLLGKLQQQSGKPAAGGDSAADAFWELLQKASKDSKAASKGAEEFLATGEGELHRVQLDLAKADITFRLLVEVRNKLTDAYQEISRLNM